MRCEVARTPTTEAASGRASTRCRPCRGVSTEAKALETASGSCPESAPATSPKRRDKRARHGVQTPHSPVATEAAQSSSKTAGASSHTAAAEADTAVKVAGCHRAVAHTEVRTPTPEAGAPTSRRKTAAEASHPHRGDGTVSREHVKEHAASPLDSARRDEHIRKAPTCHP